MGENEGKSMNKDEINKFIEDNWEAIENIADFTIKSSIQYNNLASAFLWNSDNSYQDYNDIGNINLNPEDIKQQLYVELFKALEKKRSVNLSYIGQLFECRLKNILRRYRLEKKRYAQGVVVEELEVADLSTSPDVFISDIITRIDVEKALLLLEASLEKEYLKIIVGNLGLPGYEKYAIRKKNKDESDDLCIAKMLGFDSAERNEYRKIKKSVNRSLHSVVKDYDYVA